MSSNLTHLLANFREQHYYMLPTNSLTNLDAHYPWIKWGPHPSPYSCSSRPTRLPHLLSWLVWGTTPWLSHTQHRTWCNNRTYISMKSGLVPFSVPPHCSTYFMCLSRRMKNGISSSNHLKNDSWNLPPCAPQSMMGGAELHSYQLDPSWISGPSQLTEATFSSFGDFFLESIGKYFYTSVPWSSSNNPPSLLSKENPNSSYAPPPRSHLMAFERADPDFHAFGFPAALGTQ